MKLDRLVLLLERLARLKLYVLTSDFGLCGYASHPLRNAQSLRIRIDASVRVILATKEILREPQNSGTLFLTADHKVTRRIQTHRRHLQNMDIPQAYFTAAQEL